MIADDSVRRALATLSGPTHLFADLFAERTVVGAYEVLNGVGKDVQLRTRQGIGLRVTTAHGTRHVYTSDLSEQGLEMLTQTLQEHQPPRPPSSQTVHIHDEDASLADLKRVASEVSETALAEKAGQTDINVIARMFKQQVQIGCEDGGIYEDLRAYAAVRIDVTVRQGRKVRSSQRAMGARWVSDLCEGDGHRALARQAMQAALRRLEAIDAPSGEFTVILGPGGPATLLHEACGHPLEADLALHPKSAYHGLLQTPVAAPCVTLLDSPGAVSHTPVYTCDDEGEPGQATVLIEKGVLRSYLFDRRTARAMGQRSNAHARRLSYAYPPLPRMSMTYIAPGESHPDEILAETPRGILVREISGGDTDMGSGRFNLLVNDAYLIEDGRITAPLKGIVLSGRGPDILRAIDRVGNDTTFVNHCYVCNKLNQFPLLVSIGQPTLRVSNMRVWGG
jgi:TldD protein